jgi:hypothetical protein
MALQIKTIAKLGKLIHIGKIHGHNEHIEYLYLRKSGPSSFEWYADGWEKEEATGIKSTTLSEAFARASDEWRDSAFSLIHCGYRYDLQERDDIGVEALFYQMVESYHSSGLIDAMWCGKYNDVEAGHECFVDKASEEALELMRKLEREGRLYL